MANSETSENSTRKVLNLTLARLHKQTCIAVTSEVQTFLSQATFPTCLLLFSVQISLFQNNILTVPKRNHPFFLLLTSLMLFHASQKPFSS